MNGEEVSFAQTAYVCHTEEEREREREMEREGKLNIECVLVA